MKKSNLLNLNQVKYDEDVYPRDDIDKDVIKQCRLNLKKLPPIIIAKKDQTLIDGYHRWLAYRDEGQTEIPVKRIDIPREQYLLMAIKLNSKHGKQLTITEKKRLAKKLRKDGLDIKPIANVLSISSGYISEWTWKIEKEKNEERDQRILELYLACYTEREIAKKIHMDRTSVSKILDKVKSFIIEENHTIPDSLQIFNVWDFGICDSCYGRKYPGRMPGQVVENLFYYYTKPFDIVLDPMAGSGTTVDVCIAMNRRYLAYDLQSDPKKLIKKHNILDGVPYKRRYKPKLIILDPPYWSQKKGKYSEDPNNLANLDLEEFYSVMKKIIRECKRVLKDEGFIGLIVGPSQIKGQIFDHASIFYDFLKEYFKFENRIIVPYTAQQVSAADMTQAKKDKFMLKKYRDLMIFKK